MISIKGLKKKYGKRFCKKWYKKIRDRKDTKNPNYRKNASGDSLHSYIGRRLNGKKECCLCGRNTGMIDLSCINHIYNRDVKNYRYLCRSCHMKYDYKMGFRKDTFAGKRGKRKCER